MTHYETLKKRLAATPYLVADAVSGDVKLVDSATAFRLMTEAGPFPTNAIADLAKALEGFAQLDGVGKSDREFGLREIAKIAGMTYHLAYHYVSREVLVPSIRSAGGSGRGDVEALFSWQDAFVAGAVGTLRRHGINKLETLAKVRTLFDQSTTPKKNRTARKVSASEQS